MPGFLSQIVSTALKNEPFAWHRPCCLVCQIQEDFMQLKDVMSKKLVTVPVGTPLSKATEIMNEHRIRHLPVIDESDTVIGILSSKDLPMFSEIRNLRVEFFMTAPIMSLPEDAPLKEAAFKMLENKISSVLVFDSNNNVVGIITSDDLLWHLVTQLQKESEHQTIFKRILDIPTIGQIANSLSAAGI
jgi:acetoin utilization protein AcuB